MALKDIVEVNISRETASVSTAAFNIPLIIGKQSTDFGAQAVIEPTLCGSLDEVDALIGSGITNGAVHDIAAAIFRQNPSVSKVIVASVAGVKASANDELNSIISKNNDFYGVLVTDSVNDNDFSAGYAKAVQSWASANKKLAFYQTTAITNYTAPWFSTDRGVMIYHASAKANERADASWMGEGFPFDPGSSTWAYKKLNEVTADKLSSADVAKLEKGNVNYYTTIGGVDVTREGKVGSGEWIDIIIGTDWIEARIRESIYSALVNSRKIPCTDAGVSIISGKVRSVLNEAADMGIIEASSITITEPKVTPQMKAERKITGLKFSAVYQGAIHATQVNGTITY